MIEHVRQVGIVIKWTKERIQSKRGKREDKM